MSRLDEDPDGKRQRSFRIPELFATYLYELHGSISMTVVAMTRAQPRFERGEVRKTAGVAKV